CARSASRCSSCSAPEPPRRRHAAPMSRRCRSRCMRAGSTRATSTGFPARRPPARCARSSAASGWRPTGSPVRARAGPWAAAGGRVVFAGYDASGFGKLVVVDHGGGVLTRYAHLSRFAVRRGEAVGAGAPLGLVGATGRATGPHLHFEVLVRGANADPLPALTG